MGRDCYCEGIMNCLNFKEKFNSVWELRYIGIQTGLRVSIRPIKGLTNRTLLISGGLSSLVKS